MLDEVHTFSKIKDKSINDIIKTTNFLFLCGREITSTNLGNPFEWLFIRKDLNFQDDYHKYYFV